MVINTWFLNKKYSRIYTICVCFIFYLWKSVSYFSKMKEILGYNKIEHCNLPVFLQTLSQPHYLAYFIIIVFIISSAITMLLIALF